MLRAELKVVGGKQHGSLIGLETRKFLVGREQDCQMRPSSESVSRHHCVFTLDDFSVRLRDLGSTNGTFVNGKRVHGQVVLQSGDRVLIGKLEFEMVIHDAVAVQYARVAPSTGSDAGFMLTDLAEMPESAPGGGTATTLAPTKILADAQSDTLDTHVMKADNTAIVPPLSPTSTGTVAETIPTQTPVANPVPPLQDASTLLQFPVDSAASSVQAPVPAAVTPPPAPQQGMPMAPGTMMSPYGMPAAMPGAYPQPTYIPAPFASYAPQYMPSPYGMQQPFMPQPYPDPAYQQMAYQQHLAQQHYAQQQAMMAQYAPQAQASTPAISEDVSDTDTASAEALLPIKLPRPEDTGAKPPAPPPPPAPTAEGTEAPPPPVSEIPNRDVAADIIKKFMNRR